MRESLRAGCTLLLDRYVYSNIAYQCAKLDRTEDREELREWIINTEFGAFDLPRPDLNLFLDVPIGFVEQKLSAQRQGSDRNYLDGGRDIHEADIRFQMRVREVYLRQCEVDPRFQRIDCSAPDGSMLPPDAIFVKIKQAVDDVLSRS
jgi:dTMP kinase